jgi:hypothetical protein
MMKHDETTYLIIFGFGWIWDHRMELFNLVKYERGMGLTISHCFFFPKLLASQEPLVSQADSHVAACARPYSKAMTCGTNSGIMHGMGT